MDVRIVGHDKLVAKIKKLSDPNGTLDDAVRKTAINSQRIIMETTPKKTGMTLNAWTRPRKLGPSKYVVENNTKTSDGKRLIPLILDKGRGPVFPKRAKRLYIPLTNKAAAKQSGAPIPGGLVFGRDYILAKKSRAYPGTKYLTNATKLAGRELTKRIISTLRAAHG